MSTRLPRIPRLLAALLMIAAARAEERRAPGIEAGPVDQLVVSGNACGPAALLASIRCGSAKWQALADRFPGPSDKAKLLYIIRAHGLKPSTSLKDRRRWTRDGINAEDLLEVARELAALGALTPPDGEALFARRSETTTQLLRRTHDRLHASLACGFPPVLSLRRYARRDGSWRVLQHHFVTVVGVPEKLDRHADSFAITYFDPWGGKRDTATFRIPGPPDLAALELLAPHANVGKSKVRNGEATALVPSMVIGRW